MNAVEPVEPVRSAGIFTVRSVESAKTRWCINTGASARPSEVRRRPASCFSLAISGRMARGVCPAARLALAGRARPSPPPPEPCACAPAKRRLTRASTQRPRAAMEGTCGTRRTADAITKPIVHTRAALADGVRPRLRATRAHDRARDQPRMGVAASREAVVGVRAVGERARQRVGAGAWCSLAAHTKTSRVGSA